MSIVPITSPDLQAAEISWFSALCSDDYRYLGVPDGALRSSWEHCSDIVKTATARAAQRGEEMVNAARSEATALKAKADEDIASERKKAAGELKNDISSIALEIAGKVVGKELDEKTHKSLIDSFIAGVGDAS